MCDYSRDDPSIVWVAAGDGNGGKGTWDEPFSNPGRALRMLGPGKTLLFRSGTYRADLTLQTSGAPRYPLRIGAWDDGGEVRFVGSSWHFYDVSDVIVSDITLEDAPRNALSIIGRCRRNRFARMRFLNYGTTGKTSCAVFFGGSNAQCNIVENSLFSRRIPAPEAEGKDVEHVSVGLMISEGDWEQGLPNRDHILRNNRFVNCVYGILVGSHNETTGEYGHVVEENTIENAVLDGIHAKCGDTIIRRNTIRHCGRNSVALHAGSGSLVADNRIVGGKTGIEIRGSAHTVQGNCIIDCRREAIKVPGPKVPDMAAAINACVENNTVVASDNGTRGDPPVTGLRGERGSSCIVRKNLFYGTRRPCVFETTGGEIAGESRSPEAWLVDDNILSGTENSCEGFRRRDVAFVDRKGHNYGNDSGYGAGPWVSAPSPATDPSHWQSYGMRDFDPGALEEEEARRRDESAHSLIREVDKEEMLRRSFFFDKSRKNPPLPE